MRINKEASSRVQRRRMRKKRGKRYMTSNPDWLLRRREGFQILDPVGYQLPSCSHGPCLLFEHRTEEKTEKFFACAVYRSQKRCSFRVNVNDENVSSNSRKDSDTPNAATTSFCYAVIREKVNLLKSKNEEIYYCTTCNDVFSLPHVHPVKGPLEISSLRRPSQLFIARIQNDSESVSLLSFIRITFVIPLSKDFLKASIITSFGVFGLRIRLPLKNVYIEETLSVIVNAIEKSGSDGILCIGTPTVFEHFQSRKLLRQRIKSFLLDIDSRFVRLSPKF
uniref:Zinc finger GRF-type domain-containing protein n=1 Tax=Setaria digitata TaxID=48799 RepID=A0A915PMI6_9BILA